MGRSPRIQGKARPLADDVPHAEWEDFLLQFTRAWGTGEHVIVVGPTGTGKSTLCAAILKERAKRKGSHTLICATKPKDDTLQKMGWPIIQKWPPGYGQDNVILWPPYGDPGTAHARQRRVFGPVLRQVFKDGNRVVYFDEAAYLEEELNLRPLVKSYWTQARSNGITVVAGTQRPVKVLRESFSEPSWGFFFRTPDEDELNRLAEIGGDRALIRDIVRGLDPHEFVCVRRRTGEMVISRVA